MCNRPQNTHRTLPLTGSPLADEKIEGPTTELEILGIKVDSVAIQLSVLEHKMQELKALLALTRKENQLPKRDTIVSRKATTHSKGSKTWKMLCPAYIRPHLSKRQSKPESEAEPTN